jgi:hypothetical protein
MQGGRVNRQPGRTAFTVGLPLSQNWATLLRNVSNLPQNVKNKKQITYKVIGFGMIADTVYYSLLQFKLIVYLKE